MSNFLNFTRVDLPFFPAVTTPYPAPVIPEAPLNAITGDRSVGLRAALQEATVERGMSGGPIKLDSPYAPGYRYYWPDGVFGTESAVRFPVNIFRGFNRELTMPSYWHPGFKPPEFTYCNHNYGTAENPKYYSPARDMLTFRLFTRPVLYVDPWYGVGYTLKNIPMYSMRFAPGEFLWITQDGDFTTTEKTFTNTESIVIPSTSLQAIDDAYVANVLGGFKKSFSLFPETAMTNAAMLFPRMTRTLCGPIHREGTWYPDTTNKMSYSGAISNSLLTSYFGGTGISYTGSVKRYSKSASVPGVVVSGLVAKCYETPRPASYTEESNWVNSGTLFYMEGGSTNGSSSMGKFILPDGDVRWTFKPSDVVNSLIKKVTFCVWCYRSFSYSVLSGGISWWGSMSDCRRFIPIEMTKGEDGVWSCPAGATVGEGDMIGWSTDILDPYWLANFNTYGGSYKFGDWKLWSYEKPAWVVIDWDFKAFV